MKTKLKKLANTTGTFVYDNRGKLLTGAIVGLVIGQYIIDKRGLTIGITDEEWAIIRDEDVTMEFRKKNQIRPTYIHHI